MSAIEENCSSRSYVRAKTGRICEVGRHEVEESVALCCLQDEQKSVGSLAATLSVLREN